MTSCGQMGYYFSQVDHWSDGPPVRDILWPSVLLLCSGQPLVRCTPRQRHLLAKSVTTSFRLTTGQMDPTHPQDEALGQVDI